MQEAVLLECDAHGQAQVVIVPRLGDKLINGALIDRTHYRADIGLSGEHYPDGLRPPLLYFPKQFSAAHLSHPMVRNDKMYRRTFHEGKGFFCRCCNMDLVILFHEDAPEGIEDIYLVIHK